MGKNDRRIFKELRSRQQEIFCAVPCGIWQIDRAMFYTGIGDRLQKIPAPALIGKAVRLQFQHGALFLFVLPQQLQHDLSCLAADQTVIRTDKKRIVKTFRHTIQHDHRDMLMGLADHRHHRLHILRRDDQKIDPKAHQTLHILRLLPAVSGCVQDDQTDTFVSGGFSLQFIFQDQSPLLSQVGQRYADHIADAGIPRCPHIQTARQHSHAEGSRQDLLSPLHPAPPRSKRPFR